ncbi:pyocin knob domain-containing protein [Nitrobacter sp.]|uniref:pyocin knob domain-containing protein n=1 Tax=Nitrobacter sp. TaxID=29420 RepID=UPI003F6533AC
MAIRHRFSSPFEDGGVPSGQVKPSDWNDEHTVEGLLGALLVLGVQNRVVPYLDAAGAGGTFQISDFVRGIMNSADAAAFLAATGSVGLNSPSFIGTPTAPTPAVGDNSTRLATTAYADRALALLIDSAPGALDTLNELAAALGNDSNFASTVTTALALKAPLNSPTLTGTPVAPTPAAGDNSTKLATTAYVIAALNRAIAIANGTDFNTLSVEGTYYSAGTCPNAPTSGNPYFLDVQVGSSASYVSQRAVRMDTGDTYQRTRNAGTWGGWSIVGFPVGQLPGTTGTTQPAAGKVGELIASTGVTLNFSASATPGTVTSITLTPGVWDIEAMGLFNGAGATTSSDWTMAVSTTAATVTAALVAKANQRISRSSPLADMSIAMTIPRQRVAIAANTTYYLNAMASYAVSTYQVIGDIQARRV